MIIVLGTFETMHRMSFCCKGQKIKEKLLKSRAVKENANIVNMISLSTRDDV